VTIGVMCPCCGWEGEAFGPGGHVQRPNARCPACKALERQRLLALYLRIETRLLTHPARLLLVAPETGLLRMFGDAPLLDWVTMDIAARPRVQVQADLTCLPFPTDAFDAIICSHVLEHIPDDRAAMREMARVLAPGGQALVVVPMGWRLRTTYEDPSITDRAGRKAAFGQGDHVRLCGRDYGDRLAEAGLTVEPFAYAHAFDLELAQRYGLERSEVIFVCRSQR
jgi:SAM-dependent methyltransferase